MDFRNILQSLNSLSEGETKTTEKGRVHKGEYGNKYGKEDVRDQYGHKIGKKSKEEKDDKPKTRGRPVDPDKPKTGKDDPKNKKVGDIFGRTTGDVPKGKKGKQHTPMKDADKEEKKAEKAKKKSLKEFIEEVETTQQLDETAPEGWEGTVKAMKKHKDIDNPWALAHWMKNKGYKSHKKAEEGVAEAEQVTIAPAQQNTQVIKQGDKVLGSVSNPQLAAQIKQAIGQGKMSLNPSQEMTEEGGEKWIQKAIKHPGALTKKAKAAGQSTQAFAKAHAHDKGTTGKQARLAQTLSKMHESLEANGVILTEGQKEQMIKFFAELELGPKGYNIRPAVELKDKKLALAVINKTLAHGRFRSMAGSYKDQMRDAALEHFGFTSYEESLEEGDNIPHPSKDSYRQHAIQHGVDTKVGDPSAFTPSRIQAPKEPVEEPTPWKVDPINAATDRAINFISGLRKKPKLESTEMKDVQFESWEKELNNLLNEGITVSTSTGQQGAPDSVSINATDNDANELLNILRQSGMGVFGGTDKPQMSPYGVMTQGEEEPTGTGTEPEQSPAVVGDGDDMLSLMKKMAGISEPSTQEPEGTASADYEEEGSEDEHECETCGKSPCECDHEEGEEEQTDEGNAFTHFLATHKKGESGEVGGKKVTDTSDYDAKIDEDDMEEGAGVMHLKAEKAKEQGKDSFKLGDKEFPVKEEEHMHEGEETCNECGMYESSCECEEQVEEGFSNDAGGDAMAETELAKLKALLSMGGDLHKMKRDQTVLNPTQVSMAESLAQWKKLSGIK